MSDAGAPRVSVVMSVHNDIARLEGAVRSILSQSHRDLELIVIDDGSRDGSGDLLDSLASTDVRMRVIHQDNTGLTQALARGCGEARGEFIARQDADDWAHPLRIAEQVELIESDPRIGFVSCGTQYVGPSDEPLMVINRDQDPETATHDLLERSLGPPAHGSVMFRRELYERVGGYRAAFHFAQDSDLWFRLAEHSWIAFLPDVRQVSLKEIDSTSGAMRPVQRQFAELGFLCRLERLQGRSEAPLLERAAALKASLAAPGFVGGSVHRTARAGAAYLLGSLLLKNGDRNSRTYFLEAIRLRPWHLKAWIRLLQSLSSSTRSRVAPSDSHDFASLQLHHSRHIADSTERP